jgi:hypothetical protein
LEAASHPPNQSLLEPDAGIMSHKHKAAKSPVLHLPADERVRASLEIVKRYVAQHGMEAVQRMTVAEGSHLGHWVNMRRMDYRRRKVPKWLKEELESIPGWTWNPVEDRQRRNLAVLREYVKQHGWQRLTSETEFGGLKLGSWVGRCRRSYAKGTLAGWLEKKLKAVPGWQWKPENSRQIKLQLLREYVERFGWDGFRTRLVYKGVQIGSQVVEGRTRYRQGRLSPELKEQLESIPGWQWDASRAVSARERLELLSQHVAAKGWQDVNWRFKIDGEPVGHWMIPNRRGFIR